MKCDVEVKGGSRYVLLAPAMTPTVRGVLYRAKGDFTVALAWRNANGARMVEHCPLDSGKDHTRDPHSAVREAAAVKKAEDLVLAKALLLA